MTFNPRHELAELVLPGHGFFGASKSRRLTLQVDGLVDCVRIATESGSNNFLNLTAIEFFGTRGQKLDLREIACSARMSSAYDGEPCDVLTLLTEGQAIHSASERLPHLLVVFKNPVALSRIEIANRDGIYGERARHLTLDAWHGSDEILRYRNASKASLLEMFDSLMTRLGEPPASELAGMNEVYLRGAEVTYKIATALKAGSLKCTTAEIVSLLPVYAKEPVVNDCTLVFMGEAIARFIGDAKSMETSDLREFQRVLTSAARLEAARQYASVALERLTDRPADLVVGKHKTGHSELLANKEAYKAVIHVVHEQLLAWSLPSVLCYGTLLGAVRDGGFIAHDDDVDMLYFDDSSSREEMMSNRESVMQRFLDAGYRIWDSGTNFYVTPEGHSVGVDLFPCWNDGGRTSLMMEKYLYRDIPTDLLLPTSTVELYGETYPAPNDSVGLLKERYGSGWDTSNPFYEWHWSVSEPDRWPRRESSRELKAERTIMVAWGQHVGPGRDTPPKNSPSLINKALRQNYDAVELDIRLSADGVFVLGHDDVIVGRDGNICLSNTPASELARFSLGDYEGEENTIISLESALAMLGDRIAHLDPRIPHEQIGELRRTIEHCKFDPAKIIFCGYGDEAVKELNVHFPESVILYKYYGSHAAVDDFMLNELTRKQVDGLMLYWPHHYEDCDDFMQRLKARSLQVLFYVHGAWPARGEKDQPDVSLEKMVAAGVDYITSTASDIEPFRQLVARPCTTDEHIVEHNSNRTHVDYIGLTAYQR